MANSSRFAAALGALLWFVLPARCAPLLAGSLKTVAGEVTVLRGEEAVPAKAGLHLFAKDVLRTNAGASAGLILQDGTRIALGPNSELRIDEFVYQPVDGKFSLLVRLARGVMTFVSGKIAQFSPGSVRLETPVGMVGIRGTHFGISLEGG